MGKTALEVRVEGLTDPKVGDEVLVEVGVATVPGRIVAVDDLGGLQSVHVAMAGGVRQFDVDARGVGHDKLWR